MSLSTFIAQNQQPTPCTKLAIETSKCRQKRHSDVSIVNPIANFEHVIIGLGISLKRSKQLTVFGH